MGTSDRACRHRRLAVAATAVLDTAAIAAVAIAAGAILVAFSLEVMVTGR